MPRSVALGGFRPFEEFTPQGQERRRLTTEVKANFASSGDQIQQTFLKLQGFHEVITTHLEATKEGTLRLYQKVKDANGATNSELALFPFDNLAALGSKLTDGSSNDFFLERARGSVSSATLKKEGGVIHLALSQTIGKRGEPRETTSVEYALDTSNNSLKVILAKGETSQTIEVKKPTVERSQDQFTGLRVGRGGEYESACTLNYSSVRVDEHEPVQFVMKYTSYYVRQGNFL